MTTLILAPDQIEAYRAAEGDDPAASRMLLLGTTLVAYRHAEPTVA